jgi:hypothetical protein
MTAASKKIKLMTTQLSQANAPPFAMMGTDSARPATFCREQVPFYL